VVLFGKVYCTY